MSKQTTANGIGNGLAANPSQDNLIMQKIPQRIGTDTTFSSSDTA